jgi:hypothetical protein
MLRSDLRAALQEVVARRPDLGSALHPTDYRTLDDRIAARELVNRTTMASLGAAFVDRYRRSVEEILAHGAVRIDAAQPGLAPVHAAFLRCLTRLGIPEAKARLYMFGSLEVEAFAWGLPPSRGDGIIGLSARVVRLHLEGDEGMRMSDAELEFILSRELAHLQADHNVFQMLTLFARSVERELNDQARRLLHQLYKSAGLGGILLSVADGLSRPITKFLISIAFRRYYVWDINAAVGANRAALLSVAQAYPVDDALAAGVRTLLLAMLKDYRLVRRVDVGAFLGQVESQTDLFDIVRNPDRISVDRAISVPAASAGSAGQIAGLGDKILDIIRRLLGMSFPAFPVRTAGYVEMVSDLARYRKSQDFRDMVAAGSSQDPFDRGMLLLRRITDLDDISHIREFQIAPGASLEDRETHRLKRLLAGALAGHLAADLEAHGGSVDAARLGRVLEQLTTVSFQYQVATHRVLESLAAMQQGALADAAVPAAAGDAPSAGLPPAARRVLDRALIESRFDNLLETATFRDDLALYLRRVEAPAQIYMDYTAYFEKRQVKLIEAEAIALSHPDRLTLLLDWIQKHHDPAWPGVLRTAYGQLLRTLVARLRAAGHLAYASVVESFIAGNGL